MKGKIEGEFFLVLLLIHKLHKDPCAKLWKARLTVDCQCGRGGGTGPAGPAMAGPTFAAPKCNVGVFLAMSRVHAGWDLVPFS